MRSRSLRVIETGTGIEITQSADVAAALLVNSDRLPAIRKEIAAWRRGLTRILTGREVGRMEFGKAKSDRETVYRLLALYRPLRGTQPRRRGGVTYSRRSYREIADIMNREMRPSPSGKKWSASSVYAFLKSRGKIRPGMAPDSPRE